MMRRIALVSLHGGVAALAFVLASSPAGATPPPPMRYQNFHGASCQTTGSTDPHTYSSQGIFIPSTATSTVALSCPVSWSLDATTSPLQAIQFTVTFAGAPTLLASGATPFDPLHVPDEHQRQSQWWLLRAAAHRDHRTGDVDAHVHLFLGGSARRVVDLLRERHRLATLLLIGAPGVTLNGYSVVSCVSTSILNCAPM